MNVLNALEALRPNTLDLSSEGGRSRERFRRAALTTLASVAAKAIAFGTNLVSIPLTLNYLGTERFGLWVAISAANALLDFADLGISNGLMNAVAGASASEDRPALKIAVSSAFFILLGMGLLVVAISFGISPFVRWGVLFPKAQPALLKEAISASGVFAACFALNLPLGIVRRVQLGFQEGFLSNLWQGVASILSLLTLLLAIHLKAELPVLVFCLVGAPLAALALNWIHEFVIIRPWLFPNWTSFQWETGRRLVKSGLLFVSLQLSIIVFTTADPIIAASCLGLAATAGFAVAQRLFSFIYALQAMWIVPLWPAYGEAWARGDRVWVRRTLKRSVLFAAGSSLATVLLLVLFRWQIFPLWLHRDWAPNLQLSLALGISVVVLSVAACISMFLNGLGAIREQAGVMLGVTALVTLLKVALCGRIGEAGIPLGFLIGYLPIVTPFFYYLSRGLLKKSGPVPKVAFLKVHA